jgi:NADH:ubiquinone oxidoreductase subunit 6 (subunit J)
LTSKKGRNNINVFDEKCVSHKHVAKTILRDYYMTFSISALVLAQDSHIKPDIEAGRLIWVEG